MKYLLALDQGTTSARTLIFDETGAIVSVAQLEIRQSYPQPGWVEHDAMEIWETQATTITAALASAGLTAAEVAAIGVTNQRETTVLWNRRTGIPLAPAIVWQDRRVAAECEALRAAGHEPLVQRKTGLLLDAYFSALKLRWLLDHVPGARAQAERGELAFGTIDSWLVWQLTGGREHLTDRSNASRTMLLNLHTGEWDDELLQLFSIPRSVLPRLVDSSGVCATATAVVPGVPIAGLAGDQQAALFGQACTRRGLIKCTYGTGCFLLLHTGDQPMLSRHRLLSTVAWSIGGKMEYALEGSVFIGGAVVQYLRDGLGLIRRAAEVEALAASVPDNGGVYFVPAFVGLGAPHWDPDARGAIFGLTRGSGAGHLARAALESIAYQVTDVVAAMQGDAGLALEGLRVDGGAAANNLLMQFQADLLGCPVSRPRVAECTAWGAAALAGLGVGLYRNVEELGQRWGEDRRFLPAMSPEARTTALQAWHRALQRSLGWAKA